MAFVPQKRRQIDDPVLQEYRTALISAAVTGQIDVRGKGAEPEMTLARLMINHGVGVAAVASYIKRLDSNYFAE